MPRSGTERSRAYAQKTDPNVSFRRTKWGRQLWIENYIFSGFDPFDLDFHAAFKRVYYSMGFGEKQQFLTFLRRFYRLYPNATQNDLDILKEEWLSSGFSEELFQNALDFCEWVYSLPKPRYIFPTVYYFLITLEVMLDFTGLEASLTTTLDIEVS